MPLWARRERWKLEDESTEGGEDGKEVPAEEDMDVPTLFGHAGARPATSNDVPEQGGGQWDEPAPSQELMSFRPVMSVVAEDDNQPGYAIISLTVELCACSLCNSGDPCALCSSCAI